MKDSSSQKKKSRPSISALLNKNINVSSKTNFMQKKSLHNSRDYGVLINRH